jgi:lysine/ornithine N-monooxygenase
MSTRCRVAIVGAGPYALSIASFLGRAGIDHRVFGEVMGFWHGMPTGMFLRSFRKASSITDPDRALSLDGYEAATGRKISFPIPLADFLDYGHWFQQQANVDVDSRRVAALTRNGDGFHIALDDGESLDSSNVVVAVGIAPFAWKPPEFEGLDPALVSHSSERTEFGAFSGREVLVIGAGQSALESAVFLSEAGASIELLARRQDLRFLRGESLYESHGFVSNLLYPEWGVGPPGVNWLMGRPGLYRCLPSRMAEPLAYRAIRPAGSGWLQPRLENVRLSTGRTVTSARTADSKVHVSLDDGTERVVDHVVLGTGYRIDLRRYSFMDRDIVAKVRLKASSPRLSPAFESTVPGLYFVGAPAAASAGPGLRFVSHTGFPARAITRSVRDKA